MNRSCKLKSILLSPLRNKNNRRILTSLILTVAMLLSFSGVALGAENNRPDQIILSWTEDTATTQTISWRAPVDQAESWVQYKVLDGNDDFQEATLISGERSELSPGYYHYEATIRDLSPEELYTYRVGSPNAWGDCSSFHTGNHGKEAFTFMYMGDVQNSHENWGAMLQMAYEENPDEIAFALMGGDMVNEGTMANQWASFLEQATGVFRQIPVMTTIGNHEVGTYSLTPGRKPLLYLKTFALPLNGPKGFEEEFYSFDYGNCHFVVLSSNYMNANESFETETDAIKVQTWLTNDLDANDKKWTFALFHHPAYPVVSDSCAEPIRKNWIPILESGGVDVVFCGHQHVYMRTKPIKNGLVDDSGIVYIMGNSGEKFYPAGPGYSYIEVEKADISNYQVINVKENEIEVITYDNTGKVIDYWGKATANSKSNQIQIKGEVNIAPYCYKEGYTSISLENTVFPLGKNRATLQLHGKTYNLYKANDPENRNRLVGLVPIAYEELEGNAVAYVLANLNCTEQGSLEFTYGDVYGNDGKIDVSDIVKTIHIIKSQSFISEDPIYYSLDVNGDNQINSSDVNEMINKYLHQNEFTVWK
ncbi:MAG: metallophosphoesterase [Eubacteriales bacterium]|nr:metallophosphoesterase [Eubacteriales bacterium]